MMPVVSKPLSVLLLVLATLCSCGDSAEPSPRAPGSPTAKGTDTWHAEGDSMRITLKVDKPRANPGDVVSMDLDTQVPDGFHVSRIESWTKNQRGSGVRYLTPTCKPVPGSVFRDNFRVLYNEADADQEHPIRFLVFASNACSGGRITHQLEIEGRLAIGG